MEVHGTDLECKELFRSCAAVKLVAVVIGLIEQLLCSLVWLFGEGAHARSDVAEASGMAQKKVARTSFEGPAKIG